MFKPHSNKILAGLFWGFLLLIACNKDTDDGILDIPIPSCGSTDEVAVFEIIFLGDKDTLFFYAATSEENVIQKANQELKKPLQERRLHVNGLLEAGKCDYNPKYDWHLVVNEWDLVEVSIEWCDIFPANPDNTGVDRACPWSSRVYRQSKSSF